MDDQPESYRTLGRRTEPSADVPGGVLPALLRVRKLLGAYLPGMTAEPARLLRDLSREGNIPSLETERLLARGWLYWLHGDSIRAEPDLAAAARRCEAGDPCGEAPGLPALPPGELPAQAAYWLARLRLLAGRSEAIAGYEAALKRWPGPRATAWFVDLLARAGRFDRAEAVWQAVRLNRRVADCDEAALLEARLLLRRGDLESAERRLREARPQSGVAWTERLLWLAWALQELRRPEAAREALRQALSGPYPAGALAAWTAALEARASGAPVVLERPGPGWSAFLAGQQARAAGDADEAVRQYHLALAAPAVAPFAAFGLACLGAGDPAAAPPPGAFFAARVRLRSLSERFRLGQVDAAAFLDGLRQAPAGADQAAEHHGRLAALLCRPPPAAAELRRRVESEPAGAARRNLVRVALTGIEDATLADDLVTLAAADAPPEWRHAVGRQLLRLALRLNQPPLVEAAARLLPGDPLVAAAGTLLAGETRADQPLSLLAAAARRLTADDPLPADWQPRVRTAGEQANARPLARALLLVEAARRGDLDTVRALLEDLAGWTGSAAPAFVVRALETLALRHPADPTRTAALPRWLDQVRPPASAVLALAAGRALPPGLALPAEVPPAWLLHQAARALLRQDSATALACTRAAVAHPGIEAGAAEAARQVLPNLHRLTEAEALARCLGTDTPGAVLTDMVEQLRTCPSGQALLDAAGRDDPLAVHRLVIELADRPDLPPRLLHHLAVLETRQARRLEAAEPALAADHWRRAWTAWLAWLASAEAPADEPRGLLLGHLLAGHRERINDHLARDEVEAARAVWDVVQQLPAVAARRAPALLDELTGHAARFRDAMATEYLLTTREAMRHGAIPEGWRGDYRRGLALLERLLALDGDNVRLLTALVETCNDWALDLYHGHDEPALRALVERCTPPAERLRTLADAGVAARGALAEFWKLRGFVELDRDRKIALYHEALRLDPANPNLRDLLRGLNALGEDDD